MKEGLYLKKNNGFPEKKPKRGRNCHEGPEKEGSGSDPGLRRRLAGEKKGSLLKASKGKRGNRG